jgi:hypothetical protein
MNNKLYDALEICLQAMENGDSLDSVLARFPDLTSDLRPILEAARRAREIPAPLPSADATRRGRAALLQRAAEMREAQRPIRRRQPVIPFFQRLAIALSIAAIAWMSGTGLVQASTTSLPGENLYPVKRTWEDMRLLFVSSPEQREALEGEYEVERLDEVAELLREGRVVSITFTGLVTENTDGSMVVSGLPVALTAQTRYTGDPLTVGASVIVTGQTDSVGRVTALSVQTLPPGTMVPTGEQEEESSHDQGGRSSTFHIEGTLQSIDGSAWVIDGQTVYVENPALQTLVQVGMRVEVRGYFSADGRFIVTRVEIEDAEAEHDNSSSENDSDSSNDDSNTNENSNDDNTNENTNDENENQNTNDNDNNKEKDEDQNDNSNDNDNGDDNGNLNDNSDDNDRNNENDNSNDHENDNSGDDNQNGDDNENNNEND